MSLFSALATGQATAQESDIGYNIFAKYRHFGAKQGVDYVVDGIDANKKSAQRFFSTLPSNQFSYLKNTGRTFKEAMSYGDWDKKFRLIAGYENDTKRHKTSRGSYGRKNNNGSFFLLADGASDNRYWRMGAGLALSQADSDYDNRLSQDMENILASLYLIYNDAPNKIRWRGRVYAGFGETRMLRRAKEGRWKAHSDDLYYGFENSLAQTFYYRHFFVQPLLEFNGYAVHRGRINENGGSYNLHLPKDKNYLLNGLAGLYAGYNGRDAYENRYNLKFGPDINYVFSSPYKSFWGYLPDGEDVFFKKGDDMKAYVAWKAYANYYFDNGISLYADWRYYHKGEDYQGFAIGINYAF